MAEKLTSQQIFERAALAFIVIAITIILVY
jgi:hypothetical protein